MKHPLQLAFAALMLFLLTVPWLLPAVSNLMNHDAARIAQLAVAWVISLALVLTKGQALSLWVPHSKPMRVLVLLCMALAVAAVLTSPSLAWAFKELMLWVSFCLIALVVHSQVTEESHLRRFSQVMAIAFMFGSLQCVLAGMALMINADELTPDMVAMGYDYYRFLNHMQTVALPLAALVLLPSFGAQPWLKRMAYAGLSMGWALLLLTLGRATLLGLLLGSICLLLLFGWRAWAVLRPLAISLAMGGVLFAVLFVALPWLLHMSNAWDGAHHVRESTDSGRFEVWGIAWNMFLSHPWLGSGPMQFANKAMYVQDMLHLTMVAHPHNVYLQGLAEWGAPTTVLCLLFVGRLFFRVYQRTKVEAQSAVHNDYFERGQLLLFTFVAAFTDAAFSGNFVMPVSAVWLAVAVGLAAAYGNTQTSTLAAEGLPSKLFLHWKLGAAIASFVMLTALSYSNFLDIDSISVAKQYAREESTLLRPRFWVYGWLH